MKPWILLLLLVVVFLAFKTREGFAISDFPSCSGGGASPAERQKAKDLIQAALGRSDPDEGKYMGAVCMVSQNAGTNAVTEQHVREVLETVPADSKSDIEKVLRYMYLRTGQTPPSMAQTSSSLMDSGTGGSTSFFSQPNSGSGTGKQVFGPAFTSLGSSAAGGSTSDSTKTTQYPELMGGGVEPSTRIEGVGVVAPSKNWQLSQSGDLPTACSLGAEERSGFFPFSRCPGDKDLIPDPYRVSQTYSAASYGSKTEPVPFLTDFSAFQK